MDFNVSSMKNRTSQNGINTCMKSIKNIIKDYEPISQKENEYAIFEYDGDLPYTPIDLDFVPDRDTTVMANAGGSMVNIGELSASTGKFMPNPSFRVRASSYKYSLRTKKQTFPEVTETIWIDKPPIAGSTVNIPRYLYPGYYPFIEGNQFYDSNEVFYTPINENEILLTIESEREQVQITAKDITSVYGPGITLNKVYSYFISVGPTHLSCKGIRDPSGSSKLGLYFEYNDKAGWIKVKRSECAKKLFSESVLGVEQPGREDIQIYETHEETPMHIPNGRRLTTVDVSISKYYKSVVPTGNSHYQVTYQVTSIEDTLGEVWSYIPIKKVSVRQLYLKNRKKYGFKEL